MKGIHHGFVEQAVPDVPAIDEKELFSGNLFGVLGFADESTYPDNPGICLDSDDLLANGFSEQMADPLRQAGGRQVIYLRNIVVQFKRNVRPGQGYSEKLILDMP